MRIKATLSLSKKLFGFSLGTVDDTDIDVAVIDYVKKNDLKLIRYYIENGKVIVIGEK